MRRFEFSEGSSSKFWQIELSGSAFSVQWGRIGTAGQSQTKAFDSAAKASAEHDKLVAEKLKKGYGEVAAGAAAPVTKPAPLARSAPVVAPAPAPASASAPAAAPASASAPAAAPVAVAQALSTANVEAARETVAEAGAAPASAQAPGSAAPAPSEAEEDGVHWTDALRRRVFPRRGGIETRVPALGAARSAWGRIRKAWDDRSAAIESAIAEQGEIAPLLVRMRDRLASETPTPGTLEDDELLVAALAWSPDWQTALSLDAPVDLHVALSGHAHAVSVQVRALERSLEGGANKRPLRLLALPSADYRSNLHRHGNPCGLARLRALLSMATEADYQAACAAAAELRASGSDAQRAATTFLFPDQVEWVRADIASLQDKPYFPLVLASVADVALIDGIQASPHALYGGYNRGGPQDAAATLLDGCGMTAAAFLLHHQVDVGADLARSCYAVLGALGCDPALQAIVDALERKEAQVVLAEAAPQQPRRALRLLSPLAARRGKEGEPARVLVTGLARRFPQLAREMAPLLGAEAGKLIESALSEAAVPEAPRAQWPAVLQTPPWTRERSGPAAVVRDAIAVVEPAPRMLWVGGERDEWKQRNGWGRVEHSPEEWRAMAGGSGSVTVAALAGSPEELAGALVPRVTAASWGDAYWFPRIAARHEMAALPFFEQRLASDLANVLPVLMPYAVASLAPHFAHAFVNKKSLRQTARGWLLRHPEHAAAGLIPPALGALGASRRAAEAALRVIAQDGHQPVLLEVAERASVRDAVSAMLAADPLDRFPARLPKLPVFVDAATLPQPLLREGRTALPAPAIEALLTMLAFSPIDAPYAGIAMVRDACEPASLARLAWEVFQAWLVNGAPAKESWCLAALGHIGDDGCARRLAPLLREWPGQAAHARAVIGLDVLAAIGTDVALMHLNGIALKLKFKGLQVKAQEKIEAIAEARGFSREELEDRLAPDLGLDEDGSLRLDFGPRQFQVGFDEQLRPFVKDAVGARLKDLPKPRQDDDAERAGEAAARWSQLKKDARTAAGLQILRLELAMCTQRRFPAASFQELFVRHPLVFHIVRRLVWARFDAAGVVAETFRVAEDRTLADADDAPFSLSEHGTLGIPHALELDASLITRWGQVFADYELIQPFAQLGRPVFAPTDDERTAKELKRWQGLKLATGKVLGLEQRGWRRGPAQDGGVVGWMEKPLAAGVAMLELDPGLFTGMLSEAPEQTLGRCVLGDSGRWHWGAETGRAFGVLGPIAFSELAADLERLRG